MKKVKHLFAHYVFLLISSLISYTQCSSCTKRPTSPTPYKVPQPSPSQFTPVNNSKAPSPITQEMIDKTKQEATIYPHFQFLVDRLEELKVGNMANINKQDDQVGEPTKGFAALHFATLLADPTIISALLQLGADPIKVPQPSPSQSTPVNNSKAPSPITQEMIDKANQAATMAPNFQFLVERLEELRGDNRANINKQDDQVGGPTEGFTALHFAALLADPSTISALLQLGANPTKGSNINYIPLHLIVDPKYSRLYVKSLSGKIKALEGFLNDPNIHTYINIKLSSTNMTVLQSLKDNAPQPTNPDYQAYQDIVQKMTTKGAI